MMRIPWYWWVVGISFILLMIVVSSGTNLSQSSIKSSESVSATVPTSFQDAHPSSEAGLIESPRPVDISQSNAIPSSTLYEVVRVIDGDTIEVMYEGEKHVVRYIGVDTPETVHPSKPVECMGKEASAYNASLVAGKQVRLETDISDTDKYSRLLRYVYADDMMVNEMLVKEGFANVITYPPDVKYNKHFLVLEQEARARKRGLWSEVCADYESAGVATVPSPTVHASQSDASCTIKGNISASGEKIFHVLGCQFYQKTIITEEVGERWFCTEQEAISAGWRKALNCG